MTMEKYIKTKEFAELTGVSVRTLQYYDDIKVLTPAYVNEQGHRFYDSDSFSSMFVILSLKNMGMTLSDIQQYLNNDSFDVRLFIREEKERTQTALSDLQLRFMRLSALEEKVSKEQDVTPYILPLFSPLPDTGDLPKGKPASFNLKLWNTFIKELDFCAEHRLSAKDDRAEKCVQYWKKNILEANQVPEDTVKKSEEYYQQNPANTFGITQENYRYLVQLIDEYDAGL
ncbi:MerR family transcriptional regulator [Paenibacillus sp. FSL H7-0756]|uniref:MerR family transcriptional regulator n=2 Tax=unclassified Paenibacillus TaxID=185978 RepID=UPI0030FDA574